MSKIQKVPPDKNVITAHAIQFSGPLPAPGILKGYEEVEKGSANRIITMAEEQMSHRHSIEKSIINTQTRNETLGIVLGFILALILVLIGSFLIYFDKNIEGFILVLTPIGTIIGLFIYQTKGDAKE